VCCQRYASLVGFQKLTDDMIVVLLHGELDLRAGIRMTETKNRSLDIARLQLLDQFLTMLA
jgi:hypothetical protein